MKQYLLSVYPASTATVVRVEGDGVLVTDGPFVEGKEHVGGLWVIDSTWTGTTSITRSAPTCCGAWAGPARRPGRIRQR